MKQFNQKDKYETEAQQVERSRNYLITGAAGFIGSNIARLLSKKGHAIIVCDRFRSNQKWKNLEGVLIADYVAPEDVLNWLSSENKNVDAIIHMGAISATTETDVDKIIANNFKLSSDLWRLAAKFDLPFIYASSAATYGDGANGFDDNESLETFANLKPLNPYGWSKLIFDRRVLFEKNSNYPTPPQWVGLKFFNVYGPNEEHKGEMRSVINKIFPLILNDQPVSLFKSDRPEYIDGGQLRDFIYVEDCVNIINFFLENRSLSGIYNVGTGYPRSFNDIVNCVARSLNKKATIQYIDMPNNLRAKYQYYTRASIQKLINHGYAQKFFTLEEGVDDYMKHELDKVY